MDELIDDSRNYFLNYNHSPKIIKEPVEMLFNKCQSFFWSI